MGLPLIGMIGDIFKGLIDLGKEYIPDKDKQVEFAFKMFDAQQKVNMTIMQQQTVPWVDALVKIMFAVNSLWRPIMGAAMTAFGIYAHIKGIPMGEFQWIFDGAFPAWGVSRHFNKMKGS